MNGLDLDQALNKAIEDALANGDPNVHQLIDLRARADHANADVELADLAISKQLNVQPTQAVSATYTISIPVTPTVTQADAVSADQPTITTGVQS